MLGLEMIGAEGTMNVYPNPSNGVEVKLNYGGNDLVNYEITVQDVNGRNVPAIISSSENTGEVKIEIDSKIEASFVTLT